MNYIDRKKVSLRFLESESCFWVISNRLFESLFWAGIILFFWPEGWLTDLTGLSGRWVGWVQRLGGIVGLYALIHLTIRYGRWDGFLTGYECGVEEGDWEFHAALAQWTEKDKQDHIIELNKALDNERGLILFPRNAQRIKYSDVYGEVQGRSAKE